MSSLNDDREMIYQFVYLRIGLCNALAQDITQDIFLDIYKGFDGFKGLCSERTWIYKITRNKINDYYRKNYSSKFEIIDINDESVSEIDDRSQDIQAYILHKFESYQVRKCLDALAEPYRIILSLKYIDEMSTKEIARIIGKSPKAVESLLHRAKVSFLKQYSELE